MKFCIFFFMLSGFFSINNTYAASSRQDSSYLVLKLAPLGLGAEMGSHSYFIAADADAHLFGVWYSQLSEKFFQQKPSLSTLV